VLYIILGETKASGREQCIKPEIVEQSRTKWGETRLYDYNETDTNSDKRTTGEEREEMLGFGEDPTV